jgi:S1-C subfamily serine protease
MKRTILLLLLLACGTAQAATLSTRDIATEVTKATVSIRSALPGGTISSGSGFITDSSGTIVTNYHVVEGAERVEVRVASGETYEVTAIRAVDRKRDLAILQIPGFKLPTVTLGDSDTLGPGEPLVVVGNALGVLENSVTTGVVSGMREVEGTKLIQMSAAISPGNSGGPVVNDKGEVVAITVAKLTTGESLNFAIPINFARGYLTQPAQQGLGLLRETAGGQSLFSKSTDGFPKRWRSLLSGTIRTITVSDDAMLVEVEEPDQLKNIERDWMEFRKKDDKWAGTWHSANTCTYRKPFVPYPIQNTCRFDGAAEISSMSISKIEGTGQFYPPYQHFDCQKCTMPKPLAPTPFTWIPAD